MPDVALLEVVDRVATVTLNRPGARNALSTDLIRVLSERVAEADGRDDVDVLILTGADPAFCAGLDLKELGRDGGPLKRAPGDGGEREDNQGDRAGAPSRRGRGSTLPTSKPIIGAVNGATVTGGLELALQCDFLVASERARFADTHARVGVHPLWGLTVLLPQAVGMRRAREMSATGNFISASTALEWGLVNHVVAHEELLPTARRLAADIVTSDQRAVRAILGTYEQASRVPGGEAWDVEARSAAKFQRGGVDPDEIERRRRGVVDRGRSQV
ncbi:MAG TPA: enoyl-CoA hydratase [Acidimicrobiales bacterium]|nr:enoyl-CoA hydratase [Acidimicrobiales bacterium]